MRDLRPINRSLVRSATLYIRVMLTYCADHNAFLPSAIQRYHQLFMPALQVVDAILTTLGGKHASAANQVGRADLKALIILTKN